MDPMHKTMQPPRAGLLTQQGGPLSMNGGTSSVLRTMSAQDRVPQQSSFAKRTAASRNASGSPYVPGRATSCRTPHQFSVFV